MDILWLGYGWDIGNLSSNGAVANVSRVSHSWIMPMRPNAYFVWPPESASRSIPSLKLLLIVVLEKDFELRQGIITVHLHAGYDINSLVVTHDQLRNQPEVVRISEHSFGFH